MKIIICIFLIFFIHACGQSKYPQAEKARLQEFQANQDFISIERWHPKLGTFAQPKYLGVRRDGVRFVVKPQIAILSSVEAIYSAFEKLYGDTTYHQHPILFGFDEKTQILFLEFLSCDSIAEIKEKNLWGESLQAEYNNYLAKIADLKLVDLNPGNIVYCNQEGRDPFYVIDTDLSNQYDMVWKNAHLFFKTMSYVQGELPADAAVLNAMADLMYK